MTHAHPPTLLHHAPQFLHGGCIARESVEADRVQAHLLNVLHEHDKELGDGGLLSLTELAQLTTKHRVCRREGRGGEREREGKEIGRGRLEIGVIENITVTSPQSVQL